MTTAEILQTNLNSNISPPNCKHAWKLQKEEDLDPEDMEDELNTVETRSKCKP